MVGALGARRRHPDCVPLGAALLQVSTVAAGAEITVQETGTYQRPVRASGLRAPHVSYAVSGERSGRRPLASISPRANQLPAWLSANRTVAFGSALRCGLRRPFCVGCESWQGQFQGQSWGQTGFLVTQSLSYT